MPSVYDKNNFSGRVNRAAAVISKQGSKTRHFDTCFEMHDGNAVAAALWQRAQNNPKLAANLPKYINADLAKECAERYQRQNLPKVAAQLRHEAEERFNAFMASRG